MSSIELFGENHNQYQPNSQLHMFNEDVRTRIMPYGSSVKSDKELSIEINPIDEETESKLLYLFHIPYQNFSNILTRTINEFVRQTAFQLSYFGELTFEIVEKTLSSKDISRIRLRGVKPKVNLKSLQIIRGKQFEFGNKQIQIIPFSRWLILRKFFVIIPSDQTWHIRLPKPIGGAFRHFIFKKNIGLSGDFLPKYLEGKNFLEDKKFDSSAYMSQRRLLAAQSSDSWGWNARGLWAGQILDPYFLYRELEFTKNLTVIRESIVDEMNNLIDRLEIDSRITLRGFPNPEDIANKQRMLLRGEISFDEVTKDLYF